MKKYIFASLALAACMAGGVATSSCSDDIDPIREMALERQLSPTNLLAYVRNDINIELRWDAMSGVSAYTAEFFTNPEYGGTPVVAETVETNTYTAVGLESETLYYIRVKSVGTDNADSKWSLIEKATNSEQIMEPIVDDNIEAKAVTVRWTVGQQADELVVTPGDLKHVVTTEEIAAGQARIEGLTPETEYTVKLVRNGKTRGYRTFKTGIDIGDATLVKAGEDLKTILDAAGEGESFALEEGEYVLDDYALTKSVVLFSAKASEKATLIGRFAIREGAASLKLSNLILRGDGEVEMDNLVELTEETANLGSLEISGCEIRNYKKHFIYNNKKATMGDIVIDNCIIDRVKGDGGDGFDLRGGALASLRVTNTTFSNGFRAFVRCQVAAAVSFEHCTFYKLCTVDDSNNSGLFRVEKAGSTLSVTDCLFCGIGLDNPANANAGTWGRKDKIKAEETYKNNYYFGCGNNLWTNAHADDYDKVATSADPGFKDAENGDFTLSNQDMLDMQVGDPRWRP